MDLERVRLTISLSPLCRHIPRAMDSEKEFGRNKRLNFGYCLGGF